MSRVIFSDGKRQLLEFHAEELQGEMQEDGLLLSAEGVVEQQDPVMEEYAHTSRACQVQILREGQAVIEGRFTPTFFEFQPTQLIVLLTPCVA